MLKILTFCFLLMACSNDHHKIEQISRKRADSIFQLQLPYLDSQLDSLCNLKYSAGFQSKLDSLVEQRRAEIINLQEGL